MLNLDWWKKIIIKTLIKGLASPAIQDAEFPGDWLSGTECEPLGSATGGAEEPEGSKNLGETIMSMAQKDNGNRTAQDAEKKANWKLCMINLLTVFSLCYGDLSF